MISFRAILIGLFASLAATAIAATDAIESRFTSLERRLAPRFDDTPGSPRPYDEYLIEANRGLFDEVAGAQKKNGSTVTFVFGQTGLGKTSLLRDISRDYPQAMCFKPSQIRDRF